MEAKPTGSITDRLFTILTGAGALILVSNKLEDKLSKAKGDIAMPRHEIEMLMKMLRRSASLIDDLMVIIEQRETPRIDKFGHAVRRPLTSDPKKS